MKACPYGHVLGQEKGKEWSVHTYPAKQLPGHVRHEPPRPGYKVRLHISVSVLSTAANHAAQYTTMMPRNTCTALTPSAQLN